MGDALVLSGGGARGDFEVGALAYLYDNGFYADEICSTSVGSVNAIQLAHGGDIATQKAAFDRLKMVWSSALIVNDDMYDEAPWLAQVDPHVRAAITSLFSGSIDIPALLAQSVFFPPFLFAQVAAAGIEIGNALGGLAKAQSVFTLDPTRQKILAVLNEAQVAASGVTLRLVVVGLDSGNVRYVTENGHVIEVDGSLVAGVDQSVCPSERTAYSEAQQALADARTALHEAVGSARAPAQAAVRRAQDAAAAAFAGLSACLRGVKPQGLTVPLVDGVIASASIPCVFPPVLLGAEAYVDGGVRWILPLRAALDLHGTRVVAINASPAGVPPAAVRYSNANILEIAERTVADILLWETSERQLEVARLLAAEQNKSVWVVTPRTSVHDLLTIDPGLIDIHIGYGYMCAGDVVGSFFDPPPPDLHVGPPAGVGVVGADLRAPRPLPGKPVPPAHGEWIDSAADPRAAALADAITACRYRCWVVEHTVFGKPSAELPFADHAGVAAVPDPAALDQLRLLKTLLGLLLLARTHIEAALPVGSATWADVWERHQWAPADVVGVGPNPWSAFVSVAGNRPAVMRPTVLIGRLPDRPEVYLLTGTRSWIRSEAGIKGIDPRGFGAVQIIPDEVRQIVEAFPAAPDIP